MNVEAELKKYKITPGGRVHLGDWDPDDKGKYKGGKEDAQKDLLRLSEELDRLQDLLYAERKQASSIETGRSSATRCATSSRRRSSWPRARWPISAA